MAIKHGTTNISEVEIGGDIVSIYRKIAHVYHHTTWVFNEKCIRFYSSTFFTVKLANSNGGKSWNGTIQYFNTSTKSWATYTQNTVLDSQLVYYGDNSTRYELSFRGSGNTTLATGTASTACSTFTITGSNVYCNGDLLYLLDYNASSSYSAGNYTYARLFQNCTALMSSPKMSLATLPSYCYYYTYSGCTALNAGSQIMFLDENLKYTGFVSGSTYNCAYMYYGCRFATHPTVPMLSNFTNYCYQYMFANNTALQACGKLISNNSTVNIGSYSFSYMYYGCTALINANFTDTFGSNQGILGASSSLGTYALAYMFQGCTSLTYATKEGLLGIITYNIVKLSPTALSNYCYRRMYYGCSNLKFASNTTIITGGRYSHAYRIPTSGTASGGSNQTYQMWTNTGGSYTGTPTLGTTYYGFIPD